MRDGDREPAEAIGGLRGLSPFTGVGGGGAVFVPLFCLHYGANPLIHIGLNRARTV